MIDAGINESPIEKKNAATIPSALPSILLSFLVRGKG
jgi:hypothetical protein